MQSNQPVRKYSVFLLLVLTVLFLTCSVSNQGLQIGQTTEIKATDKKGEMEESNDKPGLITQEEKLSYALGMDYGKRLRYQSIQIDEDLFMRALTAARAGSTTLLTEKKAGDVLLKLQSEIQTKHISQQTKPPANFSDIKVSFKLDPELTRAHYMGDRWVSPPTYTRTRKGKEVTVEAKALVLDDRGREIKQIPDWLPTDPKMVTITPDRDNTVKITVKRPGQSSLKITSAGFTKEMTITSIEKDNVMQVEISQ